MLGVVSLLLVGCGDDSTAVRADDESQAGLTVAAVDATVRGNLSEVLAVEARDPGLLRSERSTDGLVTFTNTTEGDVLLQEWPYAAETVAANEGGGRLGLTGICGMGWQPDGERVQHDPCSAAEPVASVPADTTYTLGLRLYPRVEDGRTQPGRYEASIPLGPEATFEVAYEVREHRPDALPDWPTADAELTVQLEQIWLENPYRDRKLEVVVEDTYDRVFARRDVADIVASSEADPVPSWTFDIPAGTWRTTVVSQTDDGPMTCYSPTLLIAPRTQEVTTVILNVDENGRC